MNRNPQDINEMNTNINTTDTLQASTEPIQKTNTKKLSVQAISVLSALILIIAGLLTAGLFHIFGRNTNTGILADNTDNQSVTATVTADDEMRGVWIATVSNINFPSKQGLSEKQLKAELDTIVENTKKAGLNSIFFQAVPCADAFYSSQTYPCSKYLSGSQGKTVGSFDALSYIVKKAHENGIELHAWINPFRVTAEKNIELSDLAENHPARLNPGYCVKYADGKYYYNPAIAEVRDMIAKEAAYIAANYDVDGIHMDDYFYPYPVSGAVFDDEAQYVIQNPSGEMKKDDWRRDNVNKTVKLIYDSIKTVRSDCRFGISPFGIYANEGSNTPVKGSATKGLEAYSEVYCDAIAWAKGGYVDYLAPQIYWAFSTSVAPFDVVSRWWNANLDGTGVDLYIGHALYKIADFPQNEIPVQVEFAKSLLKYKGSIFYGYADLAANTDGISDKLCEIFSKPVSTSTSGENTAINYPADNHKTSSDTQYLLGSSDTEQPVTLNGENVSRTKDGYFSLYTELSNGTNDYVLEQGETQISHSVTKSETVAAITNTLPSFEISATYPSGETWISGGDTVSFSCTAPAGSTVVATVGGASVTLKPTLGAKEKSGVYVKEVYKGSITFSNMARDGEIITLGTVTFTAKKGAQSVTRRVGMMKQIGNGALIYAQVNRDYTYVKKSPSSSFYDDYTPASPGMRDYIVGYDSGYYKLRFGGYVSDDNVTVIEGQPLFENSVLTAESEVKKSDSQVYSQNYTELRFGVLENVPVDVWVNGNTVTIALYDTLPEILPTVNLVENPLFSSVKAKAGASGKSVLFEATLKNAENYYGYNIVYDKSFIKLRFNNPIGLSGNAALPLDGKRIYIDAGHGGIDIGARGPGAPELKMFESNLNLLISNILVEKLRALGADVYTTRTTDIAYDLYERLNMISAVVPDILVSVHHNSVADSSNASRARGYLGLYSNNSGILLAKTVSDEVCAQLNRLQRDTVYQKLAMARDHRFPSTLCEMSFISNVEEFQWTLAEGNIERSAQALCDGILKFFQKQQALK